MNALKRILAGLAGTIVTVTAFATGAGAASAHEWYREQRDWRKEVICTFDFTHNDGMHYFQDGCTALYGDFDDFERSLAKAGYWTDDRVWNYTQNDVPVYHPTQISPYNYRYNYNNRPYYFATYRPTSTTKYAPSPYSWRCVEQISRTHRLQPCI